MTEHTNFVLHRILMPTVLGVASLLRPSAISLVYLLLFFILPLTSVPHQSIPGLTKALYIVSITISVMLLTCHVGLQIALLASESVRNLIVHCSLTEVLLRHIGFIRMDDFKNYLLLVGWIAPELIVFIGSIIVFVLLKKSVNTAVEEPLVSQQSASYAFIEGGVEEVEKPRRKNLLQRSQFGALICLVMLFLTSAIRPSVIGAFYFLIFLLSGTYWATYKTLERGFGMIMRAVLFVLALHICLVTIYQTPAAQVFLHNSTLPARLMALEPLLQSTCDAGGDIRVITINNYFGWDSFVFPIVILISYYIIAVRSIILVQSQDVKFRGAQNPEQTELTERTPLMRHTKRKDRRQVSDGTETSPHELPPSSSLEEHEDGEPHPSFWDNMQDCVASLIGLACEHSYLFTSITMMTWSIIYHSWLTFVFLIWANILWMIPNQRQAMLRSSPLIVLYAECLLIAGYIYSLKLEDHELPRRVDTPGINLEKIGLVNPPDVPVCILLIVKVAFTSIFWITLRQLCKETKEKKKKPSTIQPSDIVTPRTATESQDIDSGPIEHYTSKFLKRIGRSAKNILVKSWIWLLILVIFLCAISGKKMTGFRIFYMALFLFFLLAFQISWVGWMKVMFGYWVFLIIYAMFTLVLIYTYQFDKFSEYWDHYLGIPVKLQNDIGLEKFEVKGLFLHLFAPTIIVIMTAIQVHYIHKEFIASLRRSIASRSQPDEIIKSDISIAIDDKERVGTNTVSSEELSQSKKEIWQKRIKKIWLTCRKFLNEAIDFMWIIFEVHLVKVIFIVAFVCCVETVSVLHLAFVLFCVIAVTSQEKFQVFFSRLIAVIMAILILAKMIYQIEYIHHEKYGVLCHINDANITTNNSSSDIDTNSSVSSTPSPFINTTNQSIIDNNAEWFGFIKTGDKSGNLFNMLNGYVIFMIIVTLHEISIFRKAYINANNDIEYKRPRVIFSGVKRENAEESLKGLIKYLFNYGYYKFGLEITFITLASCICFHQDLPAILYSIWLCVFVILDRRKCAKLWPAFLIFTSILIPLQYIVFVGLPPGLCIEYPWRNIKGLDEWAVLPSHRGTHKSWKLLFDFILLMFIARQQKVFNIEAKIRKNSSQYDGGSNESILDELSQLKKNDEPFINPTANFMERVRNWSDILKVCIFNGLYWITLTIVFLVATQTINLFSVGYLVGAFIFLWQGTDFYLRPLQQIIKWWSFLIYYNVAIIAIQTILQICGCLFFDFLQNNACWVVHLLGIGCASSNVNEEFENLKVCPATHDDEGVSWDTVGFALLIIQLRIFSSYYFCHVINEAKASALLAERGAELIEDLRQKEIQHREKQEQKILRKIKMKMEKIRATQQRTLGASEKATHYDDEATVPLIRSNSSISCPGSGYHTPIEDDDQNNDEFLSDLPSDNAALTIFSSSIQNQALSPSSAIMTVSLDGYLEPKRFSFGSPPNLDTGRTPPQSDNSPSVFSFPPSNENNTKVKLPPSPVPSKGLNTINTNQNLNQDNSSALNVTTRHRRQSSGTSVSWNERVKKVEPNYERRYSYKRQSSSGTGYLSNITQSQSRRCSQCAQDDSLSTPGLATNIYYIDSLLTEISSINSHGESIRAGDYYMFDDVDEKFELDLLPEEEDYLGATGKISTSEKKLKDRKTFLEVFENKRKSASAPSSQIGFKKEEESKTVQSDPLPILPSLISDKPDQPTDSTDSKSKKPSDKETEDPTEEKEDKRSAVIRIFEGILVSLAVKLNRCSRQYRYVMRVLGKEKRALKENPEFVRSNTDGQTWKPFKFLHKIPKSRMSDGAPSSSSSHDTPTTSRAVRHSITQFDIRSEPEPHTSTKTINTDNKNIETDQTDQKDLQRSELESEDTTSRRMRRTSTVPEIRVLAPSLETGLDDTTILDTQHLKDNNKIDIRDEDFDDFEDDDFVSKEHYVFVEFLIAVWYAVLANTDFVCYFVVFLNQIVSASILSLPLPFMVFMWGTLSLPRPTKTFWVTLIAYTLSVVLIKCIFQFKMIWYDYLSLPNQPLSAASIIGIESKSNYAALDLILLLVLFFHRFVLKSQGLWKSAYRIDHIHDGVYILEDKLPKDAEKHNLQRTDDDVKETAVISKDDKALVLSTQDEKVAGTDTVDSEQIHVHVTSLIDEPANYLPGVVKMTSAKYCSSITEFFKDLIYMSRLPCDVYAFMFLCDFTNFFVLLLGFTAFGSQHGDGGVSEYLTENKVPVPFLIMLLIQFFLIIADRAIYLRKSLVHKIIYHYFTIIGIHIWMFFVVPGVTERKFNALAPPIIFYMVKCFYFLLSSYQIRSGYPKRILGNFLCKSFTVVNMTFFKIYMAIPFLYELRTFLDWVCTESTFTVFDWLKMEDIFAEIFNLKCARQMEKDFPVPRAQKKPMFTKIIMGGLAVVAIVVLIWAPLTLFALNNAVGYANVPFRATALLQIGPYEPIYEIRTADSIKPFDMDDMIRLQNTYRKDKTALTFITSYDEVDIAAILLQTNSPELWRISPPSKNLLINDIKEKKDIAFHFSYTISRSPPNKQASETLSGETKYMMTTQKEKDELYNMLTGVQNNYLITLTNIFPKFIKIKNSGEMSVITPLTPEGKEYRDISIKLFSDPEDADKVWWEIREVCTDDHHKNILKHIPHNKMCDKNVTLITFNDKKFPDTFSFLTAGGIIGMYTTFILVAARVLRSSLITGASRNIMFEELPYVDRVLQLCLDIYLVREAQEFALEEDLFAKLIFLYRSPETMIKWTRPKEKEDETDETGSVQSRSSRRTIK